MCDLFSCICIEPYRLRVSSPLLLSELSAVSHVDARNELCIYVYVHVLVCAVSLHASCKDCICRMNNILHLSRLTSPPVRLLKFVNMSLPPGKTVRCVRVFYGSSWRRITHSCNRLTQFQSSHHHSSDAEGYYAL